MVRAEQFVAHQPALSFSILFQHSFNRAGGRTFDVVPKTSRKYNDFRTQEVSALVTRQVGRFFAPDACVAAMFAVIRAVHVRGRDNIAGGFFPRCPAAVALYPAPSGDRSPRRKRHNKPLDRQPLITRFFRVAWLRVRFFV